jgi:hypothetical protein
VKAKSPYQDYIVEVREVHIQQVRVRARTTVEAKRKVANGDGFFLDNALEYAYSLDSDTWTVEKEN